MEVVNQKNLASSYSPNAIPPLVQSKVLNHLHGDSTFKDSFFVADETYIQHQLKRWESRFEDIQPFYAMKCNDNPTVLKILAKNGAGFDCASESEIKRILELGVEPHRILFAAPFKSEDHVLYAKKHGVEQTMFDSEDELRKLATYFPTAALYLRLWADDPTSRARLSEKFGVRLQEAKELLKLAKDLNMRVVGLCFHVGSSASDCDAYRRAIALTREVYDYNETFGEGRKHPIGTVDVGGGFSSENFDDAATAIRQAIREYFDIERKIRWVAEPGRFFVHEAFHLICRVIGTRPKGRLDHQTALGETIPTGDIYINDGIYHNFLNALTEKVVPQPILLDKSGVPCRQSNEARGKYTVWGQTCDSFDKILMDCPLPSGARVGEWLYFPAMGSYAHVTSNDFNGFPKHKTTIWISNSNENRLFPIPAPISAIKALHYFLKRSLGMIEDVAKQGKGSKMDNEVIALSTNTGILRGLWPTIRKTSHAFEARR